MAFFSVLLILGINIPLLVLFTSKMADALAVLPSVLMENDWAIPFDVSNIKRNSIKYFIKKNLYFINIRTANLLLPNFISSM